MQIIPLSATTNQTAQIVLAGQNCSIEINTLDGYATLDNVDFTGSAQYITFTLDVAGVSITRAQNCLNLKRLLINRQYLGFVGDFMFIDTQPDPITGSADPQYTGLGSRWQLVYLEASDLDAEVAPIFITARPGPGPALPPPPAPPPGNTVALTVGVNGNPCCTCPCGPGGTLGFSDGVAVPSAYGSVSPGSILGALIRVITEGFSPGGPSTFSIFLDGVLAQSIFTTVTIQTDSSPVVLNSSAATYGQVGSPTATFWQWTVSSSPHMFTNGHTYNVTFA